ncbi:hypothetical protein ASF69_04495 [Rhizobium sp. Leaf311]|uniref:hypothetical protein n=1 Tax=Rhizobium sp. Leaf311 TaxID=1736332 RepID=UPI00071595C0|nr:hypothetical protein [Rhizobium sp. Leaf311]KQQ46493.1 hypothetical protein ASF69_04495 [Rhizobium sp. Leaf311]
MSESIVIPHQDYVCVDVIEEENRVDIRQEDSSGNIHENVVSICGHHNLSLIIEALKKASEVLS